jgi:hypothetical protein
LVLTCGNGHCPPNGLQVKRATPTALWTDSRLQQDEAALVASSPAPSSNVNLGPVKREYLGVELTSHHANRPILTEGDPLPVRFTRSRNSKAPKRLALPATRASS